MRLASRRLGAIVSAAALAAVLVGCLGSGGGSQDALRRRLQTSVVHVSVVYGGRRSSAEEQWIDVPTGRYRLEGGRQTWIFTGRAYEHDDGRGDVTVRIGSRRFLGDLADLSAVSVLRAALDRPETATIAGARLSQHVRDGHLVLSLVRGNLTVTVRVVGAIPRDGRSAARLFRIDARSATSLDRELPAGTAPSFPFHCFWLGPSWHGRTPRTEAVHIAHVPNPQPATQNLRALFVFYETPAAGTQSSAYAGSPTPAREVQVLSLGRRSALARRKIMTTHGHPGLGITTAPWPRRTERLADGERAVVIPFRYRNVGAGGKLPGFYVLTRTTLVSVNLGHGMQTALALAKDLRPLPAAG
jgi:hypothetical protein